MRFYNRQHRHYCGIDLHVKTMYVCILDAAGQVLVHRNVKSTPAAFLETVAPYREDLVVAAECMFTWYWLADVCAAEAIPKVANHGAPIKRILFVASSLSNRSFGVHRLPPVRCEICPPNVRLEPRRTCDSSAPPAPSRC
jgi:hypothetical protein